jgi:hypothetical protein
MRQFYEPPYLPEDQTTVMFHATSATDGRTPTGTRKSILKYGLDWRRRGLDLFRECDDYHEEDYGEPPDDCEAGSAAPKGTYLWDDLPGAIVWANVLADCPAVRIGPGMDIWEVNIEGLSLYEDPQADGAAYTREVISPKRLKLLGTIADPIWPVSGAVEPRWDRHLRRLVYHLRTNLHRR